MTALAVTPRYFLDQITSSTFFLLLLATLFWSPRGMAQQPSPMCIAKKCPLSMVRCAADKDCRGWLGCVKECGDDQMKCPSFCGFYHQSPSVNKLSACMFESKCVDPDYSDFGDCKPPQAKPVKVASIEGDWWLTHYYEDQIFDYDCQKFEIRRRGDRTFAAKVSVPLTEKDLTKVTMAEGVYKLTAANKMEVHYETFAGFNEKWTILHKSPNIMMAYVCFMSGEQCYRYGTLVLMKESMDRLSGSDELAALNESITVSMGMDLGSFSELAAFGQCLNGRQSL